MAEPKIFVFYVGVGDLPMQDVGEYMDRVRTRFFTDEFVKKFEGSEMILLPVRETDSRIECINPKYITEEELVREHRLKMDYLHENLDKFIKENNEK